MTRQTSIECYNTIKENGLLKKLKWRVYDYIYHHGPVSQNEAYIALTSEGMNVGSIGTRFSELERQGAVTIVGTKLNPATGMEVYIWDTTNNIPVKLEKPTRHKCNTCNGKGYIETTQAKLF